jgi:hypothetical protein
MRLRKLPHRTQPPMETRQLERRKRLVLSWAILLGLALMVGVSRATAGGSASPLRLLVRGTELTGFQPSGKATIYSSTRAWVERVDAGDPTNARRDRTALPREGFLAGAFRREKTLTGTGGAGFSAGLVFKTHKGAAADTAYAFSSSLAATRRSTSGPIKRFTVPGLRKSKGFTAFGSGGMAGNVYFAVGRCEADIGEQLSPSGGISRALLTDGRGIQHHRCHCRVRPRTQAMLKAPLALLAPQMHSPAAQ